MSRLADRIEPACRRLSASVLLVALCGFAIGSPLAAADEPSPEAAPRESPPPESLRYAVQRGDELEIRVFHLPELEGETRVRPDGRISVLLLDDVAAVGKTPEELAAALAEGWSRHFHDPRVTVVVREFASHNVYVGGEVRRPGLFPLTHRLSSIKAVLVAGGFKSTAQLTNVIVLRNVGRKPEVFSLDARKVLEGETKDLSLEPYDVVFVPKSRIAQVNLFVDQWITQMIPIQLHGSVNYNYLGGIR